MTLYTSAAISTPTLKACPNKPNCVSSIATDSHHIAPFRLKPNQTISPQQLSEFLKKIEPRISLEINKSHLHAEISSRFFAFIDDVDLIIDPKQQLIHLRSAARTGYYDFGVNRRRIEKLRTSLQQAGFIL